MHSSVRGARRPSSQRAQHYKKKEDHAEVCWFIYLLLCCTCHLSKLMCCLLVLLTLGMQLFHVSCTRTASSCMVACPTKHSRGRRRKWVVVHCAVASGLLRWSCRTYMACSFFKVIFRCVGQGIPTCTPVCTPSHLSLYRALNKWHVDSQSGSLLCAMHV